MTVVEHYATCRAWVTGRSQDCSCPPRRPWRIQLAGSRWEVLRWLDNSWEHFVYASTHQQAASLVRSLERFSSKGFRYLW